MRVSLTSTLGGNTYLLIILLVTSLGEWLKKHRCGKNEGSTWIMSIKRMSSLRMAIEELENENNGGRKVLKKFEKLKW